MDDELRSQLAELDEEIARMRSDVDGLTEQLGGNGVGAQDSEDRAAALTNLEESRALLANLEQRHERLTEQLRAE